MRKILKHLPKIALAAVPAMLLTFSGEAAAVALSAVNQSINSQFQSIADLLSGGAYLVGAGIGIQSALKFKEHNENPQQVKLSKPVTYALVAGMLLALPSFLTVGSDSSGLSEKNSLKTGLIGGESTT